MEIKERIQDTAQGRLVRDAPVEYGLVARPKSLRMTDAHAAQVVRPTIVEVSLDPNPVHGRCVDSK